MATIEQQLRTAPLTSFTENLILTSAAEDSSIYIWEPKTLAMLHTYRVIANIMRPSL